MFTENFLQSDFFDSKDSYTQFQFTSPNACHQKDLNTSPKLTNSFKCEELTSNDIKEGSFALQGHSIVFYETANLDLPTSVLDLSSSRLKSIASLEGDLRYGFMVAKNGNCLKFYCNDKETVENWISALKGICILTSFNEDYKTLEMIGRGSFAKVYLLESQSSGKQYAAKIFTKEPARSSQKEFQKESILNEIDVMRNVNHEGIIKLYEVYENSRNICLVVELVKGKSLQDILEEPTFLTDYSEDTIISIIRSILDALSHLSSKGIMHRDLKPEHVLVEEETGKIKIIDLGLATEINVSEYIFKKCGSPGYIAPEVFNYSQNAPDTFYNDRCDVFSAGCILFFMLFGTPLFDGNGISTVLELNKDSDHITMTHDNIRKQITDSGNKINKEGLNLLQLLLNFDKNSRISANEALSHPYIAPMASRISPSTSVRSAESSPKTAGSPLVARRARHNEKKSLYVHDSSKNINVKLAIFCNKSTENKSDTSDCDSVSTTSNSPVLIEKIESSFLQRQKVKEDELYGL